MSPLRRFLGYLVQHDWIWNALQPLVRPVHYMIFRRGLVERRKRVESTLKRLATDLGFLARQTVLHGPFQGLKYPSTSIPDSYIFPRLIGSYERELHELVERIVRAGYEQILDIGAAEGYYACGLAMRMPHCRVLAYEMQPEAARLCREMAALNGVGERVQVRGQFSPQSWKDLDLGPKTLILCDCEGFEAELFGPGSPDFLRNSDLLVETHDFEEMTISTRLRERFQATHGIEVYYSLDDLQKAKTYSYPETDRLDLRTRALLFDEGRPMTMEWLYMKPLSEVSARGVE